MEIQIRIPEVGESVHEAVLAEWYRRDGDFVKKGDVLFAIETDKVTLEVSAEADGVLRILVREGATAPVGSVVGVLDTAAKMSPEAVSPRPGAEDKPPKPTPTPPDAAAEPAPMKPRTRTGAKISQTAAPIDKSGRERSPKPDLQPSVERMISEKGIDVSKISGSGPGGKITRGDVLLFLEESPRQEAPVTPSSAHYPESAVRRAPMSRIRLRIAERLLEARQNTAMLTTFNEIDMSRVQDARTRFREAFLKKYGVPLGIMSFFIKAAVVALKEFPEVNASIDERDIVYHDYYHIGIAVGAERGLVVPVIRHADSLGFGDIEKAIRGYVIKIEKNLLELSDLEGGTFTITNGGVYGSLMSTPILNTPQSGILGMHKIEERPVVAAGQIVIRPMMYVALSYDHRLIDGREAVGFLKRIKECVENPERIAMEI